MGVSHRIAFVAALLAVPCQGIAQTIVGRVVDRSTGDGLAGANVVLLDTSYRPVGRTVTSFDGRYVLETGRPGQFLVSSALPGHAANLSEPLVIVGTEFYEHTMAVDLVSLTEMAASARAEGDAVLPSQVLKLCNDHRAPPGTGAVVGMVSDSVSGLGLPGVWVVAQWGVDGPTGGVFSGEGVEKLEAPTGGGGLFLMCGLEAGRKVALRAVGAGAESTTRTVLPEAGVLHRVDLDLPLAQGGAAGSIAGRVTDYGTGRGVEDVDIRLRGTEIRVLTDRNGHFAVPEVPPGTYALEVSHIGFGAREVTLHVAPGVAQQVRVAMTREAILLDPIVVSVRSRRWFRDRVGFQRRMLLSFGHFFAQDDVERRQPSTLLDLLATVPGFRARTAGRGHTARVVAEDRGDACEPIVYVDRARWGGDTSPFLAIPGADLEAVEFYHGGAWAPQGFATRRGCGTVLVWTKRGIVSTS